MTKAFQRIYTQLESITKATVSLRAQGVSNEELATVAGRLAQVVKIKGDVVTLQIFSGTEGIPTNAEVMFFGEAPALNVSEELSAILMLVFIFFCYKLMKKGKSRIEELKGQ